MFEDDDSGTFCKRNTEKASLKKANVGQWWHSSLHTQTLPQKPKNKKKKKQIYKLKFKRTKKQVP